MISKRARRLGKRRDYISASAKSVFWRYSLNFD